MKQLVLLLLFAVPAIAEAQAPPETPAKTSPSAELFNSQKLHEVRLLISTRDLAQMREHYWDNTYYTADFIWNNLRVRNVGIRVRGLASRSATKPGLRIDFNRYIEKQTFLGLHSLVLDNLLKDPAMIRERTAMAFIERMGQPAPREAFARVYINGEYHGLYAIVEPVDKKFLARTLEDDTGYLFDHKYIDGFHAEDLGDELGAWKARFEAQTRALEPEHVLYSPIRDLFREVNHDVDGAWRSRVSEYIDLNQLVTYVAVETFLAESDGFLGIAGMANFYLYRPADNHVHRLLAWDRDTTFQDIESSIFPRVEDNMLFRRAMTFGDLRALYLDTLERCARSATDDRWLDGQIERMSALVNDAVHQDTRKMFSNEEYDEAVVYLRDFAKWRPRFVLDEVAKARQTTRDRAR